MHRYIRRKIWRFEHNLDEIFDSLHPFHSTHERIRILLTLRFSIYWIIFFLKKIKSCQLCAIEKCNRFMYCSNRSLQFWSEWIDFADKKYTIYTLIAQFMTSWWWWWWCRCCIVCLKCIQTMQIPACNKARIFFHLLSASVNKWKIWKCIHVSMIRKWWFDQKTINHKT